MHMIMDEHATSKLGERVCVCGCVCVYVGMPSYTFVCTPLLHI